MYHTIAGKRESLGDVLRRLSLPENRKEALEGMERRRAIIERYKVRHRDNDEARPGSQHEVQSSLPPEDAAEDAPEDEPEDEPQPPPSKRRKLQTSTNIQAGKDQKSLEAKDIEITTLRQAISLEPYERSHSIVRGSRPTAPLPARYQSSITTSRLPDESIMSTPIPAHLADFIETGIRITPTDPLPPYMRDHVIVTRVPRSEEMQFADLQVDEAESDEDKRREYEKGDEEDDEQEDGHGGDEVKQ